MDLNRSNNFSRLPLREQSHDLSTRLSEDCLAVHMLGIQDVPMQHPPLDQAVLKWRLQSPQSL